MTSKCLYAPSASTHCAGVFPPKKPIKRAFQRRPKEIKVFKEQTWPEIDANAKREGETVVHGDQTGGRVDHLTGMGTSLALIGRRAVITNNGARYRLNAMISMTLTGALIYSVFEGTFDSARFIECLKQLLREIPGKIRLVVDRLSVHRSRETLAWLNDPAHPDRQRLRISLLPAYAPELNPVELVNHYLKATMMREGPPKTPAEFRQRWIDALEDLKADPDFVMQFYGAEELEYLCS